MPNSKNPFIYTLKHKFWGTLATSSSGTSAAPSIPNNGVTQIALASTYTLASPDVGSLVTLVCQGVDASVISKTSSGGACSFNGGGGAQRLDLAYDSTTGQDAVVTLLGLASTRWCIMSAWPPVTSNAGVFVTT